ncbi:hypothetical protein AGMMS49991_11530 [Spirochaetia bacterium]|nr:hypothetical protein AGMMS49991_11530 [Spirochaetia bacterium]
MLRKQLPFVRKTIGYARFQGDPALAALSSVYVVLNPLMNFFYPNMSDRRSACIDKLQVGQKKKRVYEKELKTPFQRVIEQPDIPEILKQSLRKKKIPWILSFSRNPSMRLLIILTDWPIMLPAVDCHLAHGWILP